jgi:phosphoribosyl-ATP pyrophosphohydrolase/phosphoribosyl-AMP cyclohydrolase
MIERLEAVLEARKTSEGEKSYTRSLFDGGAEKIGKKIREEAGEVVEAIAAESDERVASEAADVMYHVLVGLRFRGLPWRNVLGVLASRFGVGGHTEKASRAKSS